MCVLGVRGHRRPDDPLVLSVYKSSVFRKRKREQLQRCALLSMASAALRELVPERFSCSVLCPASVCICCTFPFSSSSVGPAPFPFGMAARLLSHLPHLGRPLIFLLLPPHVVGNQVPYCVIIMWMCVPLLAGPPAASGGPYSQQWRLLIEYPLWAGGRANALHASHPVLMVFSGICFVFNKEDKDSEIIKDRLHAGWGLGLEIG